jgi:cytochrome P450
MTDQVVKEMTYPPGPRGLPVLGSALEMGKRNVLLSYMDLQQKHGDIVYVKLGPLNGYLLSSPDYVYHVLVKNQKNYIKGIGYDGLRLLVGNGVLTSEGEVWRQQRRLMQPPFTPAAVTQFGDMMIEITQRLLDRWEPYAAEGKPLLMDAEMLQLTMSVIGRAMFSIDLDKEAREVGAAFEDAFAFIPTRTGVTLPLSVPLPAHRRFQRDLEVINRFIEERIAEGRRHPQQNNLLAMLLRARDEETGQSLSETDLRDEVVTLFFAGFETTARSLTWGWYLLAKHPDVQNRLAAEADRVLQGRAPTIDDLFQLNYTRQVVDEVLRLYPPTALLARQNVEADEIGGYVIPPGSMVILVPYLVHREPQLWPDPERFDPDRFARAAAEARPKQAYIPFAAGPRVCLGNNFALLEMVYAMSMAAGRYRLEMAVDEEIPFELVGTMRPTKPLLVKVRRR